MGAPSAWGSWGPPSLMGRGGAFSPDGGPAGTCVVGSACAAACGLQGGGGVCAGGGLWCWRDWVSSAHGSQVASGAHFPSSSLLLPL